MTSHYSFVIEMNRIAPKNSIESPNDALANVSNPSSRKSIPKQVKDKVESIINIRKRQHSEDKERE